jgi:predicted RND superfamily exporter protein
MRDNILKKLADWHATYPWRMLVIVILLTVILAGLSGQLTITMNMKDLLPEGDPKVDQFNQIVDEFATATSLIVVVQGEENRIKAFADDLAPRVLQLIDTTLNVKNQKAIEKLQTRIRKLEEKGNKEAKIAELRSQIIELHKRINFKLFQRVDYKVETNFFRHHALMLVKEDDLENTKDLFMDPNLVGLLTNLNNSMEKEYVGKQESISTREKEDGAYDFLDGVQHLVLKLQKAAGGEEITQAEVETAADEFLLGEPYFLSYDKAALILNCIPNFTIMDRDLLMVGYETVRSLIDDLHKQYPQMRAGLSGDIAREHDEQLYSQQTLSYTTIIAFFAILALLIISFRMWVAPVLAIINLFVGLIWAMGAAYIAVGQLNMVTAMLSVVLLGLGIDFSIHLISGFTEWRAAGDSILVALEKTFLKSGKGIITGALTTACAFLALIVSQSRGMKQMGIVAGVGLLSILVATFLFLPVLLVFRGRFIDRRREKTQKFIKQDISFRSLGRVGEWLSRHYAFTIVASIIVSAFLIWFAFQIKYDQNYLSMEPKGLESIALQDTILEKFDLSMEYALCLANSVDESRDLAEEYRDLGTVAMTNDISIYLPSEEEQRKRAPHILDVRNQMSSARIREVIQPTELPELIQQIERLEMNIMEMQDMAFLGGQDKVDNKCKEIVGDPDKPNPKNIIRDLMDTIEANNPIVTGGLSVFQKHFAPYFQQSVLNMCSTEPIKLKDLPVSVLDQYSNRARDKFMITIYPAGQLMTDARVMNRFVDDVERVSPNTTGMPPVAVAWLRIAARDGQNAILLTLLIVFILLWIDFHRPWYALIAMIPLALGAFWMVGLMNIAGLLLNFMTLMGLPLIIGIGIDDGVHIMHRWQHEGKGKMMTVFSSTGKAILLTSLTTMLAFGSMTFSVFPAWVWFGGSLFLGVGACFVTTVVVLPGILGWIERRKI